MPISVTDPIDPAIRRAKYITFQPFDLGKWFVLGFIAFLANLGEGGSGGGNFNFNLPRGGPARLPAPPGRPPIPSPPDFFSETWSWINANLPAAIMLGVLVVVFGVTIWLLMLWLSSRAQFMFIEAIAQNTAEVRASWTRHKQLGNSLFKFRAIFSVIAWLATTIIAAVGLLLAWPDIQAKTFGTGAQTAIVVGVLFLIPIGIAAGVISFLIHNFVTPIMYATGQSVGPAWSEFRTAVLPGRVGSIVLYLLMRIVLLIGVGIASMLIGCATCCIGLLPYLSSVATLPLLIFMRAYSLYFLEQVDSRYAVILEIIDPPVYGFPVMPVQPLTPDHPPPPPHQPPSSQ